MHCLSATNTVCVFPMSRLSPVMLITVPPETGPRVGETSSNLTVYQQILQDHMSSITRSHDPYLVEELVSTSMVTIISNNDDIV